MGGPGTHCVLSAHRGLPSAKLFSDLDQMEIGDIFLLKVLNETLTYEVDQINVVLPEEVQDLRLTAGMDYCTLVTCTPYGVNTHRLLVRGVRIANREEAVTETMEKTTEDEKATELAWWMMVPIVGIPVFFGTLVWLLFRYRRRRDR
ncbi:MAG: class C sortase [Lachnospiraceae bacterium]|nr:class C sortase [Lachnospiraceae bacterium]